MWKTTSAGQTWFPVFDAVKEVSSIGSVEVAPSDPNVVYVGTGDIITGGGINEGNGVYKSTDAGRTWRHIGLDATKQIPSMMVDPHDPNIVLVAAQGDVHVKSRNRGVYRSTDGGATWTQTLFVNDSTGAQKIARAFDTPNVVFATTVAHYTPPPPPRAQRRAWRRGNAPTGPTNTKLFKSTDDGVTWKEVTGGGLPERLTGKAWVAVANNTRGQRVFVIGDWGLFRSDDGGATWRQMAADDQRIRNGQGGYNCGVYVDPQNPDIVYTLNTASYKSHRRRRHVHRIQGRAGRRRSAADVDRSNQRPAHAVRLRPGRDRLARRRRHVELVVQPVAPTRSIICRSTTRSRPGCTARSRTRARSARASAATSARSRRSTGIRCPAGSGERSFPIRSTRTPCTPAARAFSRSPIRASSGST